MTRILKRILALVLALAMLGALTGCVSEEERQGRKEALNALSDNYSRTYAMDDGTTIEPIELYNDNDIIVKLIGITGSSDDMQLVMAIRNGTRKELNLTSDNLQVNGWGMSSYFDISTIKPHSVTMTNLMGYNDFVNLRSEPVWSVGTNITLYDADYNELGAINYTTFTSSYTGDETIEPLEGYTLVDQDGILIRVTQLTTGPNGTSISLYSQNNTSRHIYVGTSRTRLNGEPVELWIWNDLVSDSRYLDTETMSEEDTYDDITVTDSDELTFYLEVADYDTSTTLISKDISVSVGDLLALN